MYVMQLYLYWPAADQAFANSVRLETLRTMGSDEKRRIALETFHIQDAHVLCDIPTEQEFRIELTGESWVS